MSRIDDIEARLTEARKRVAEDHEDLKRWPTHLLSVTQHDRQVLARHCGELVAFVREVEALVTAWEAAVARRRDMNDDLFDPTLADSYTSRAADLRDLLDRLGGGA